MVLKLEEQWVLRVGGTEHSYNASDIVARQVERGRGAARAIVAQDATLTYEELRLQVNRAGWLLRELGVGREQRVVLALDDTSIFPIVFLGAIRVGAVPVPVSPLDKEENFRHFVVDSYADLIVSDLELYSRLVHILGDRDIRYLVRHGEGSRVIEFDDAVAAQPDELDAITTHRDDMAFWLYSSGSTGPPKGVVHLQHDIEVTCESFGRGVVDLTEGDITFSTTKMFHSYGLGNALYPLWFGATTVLMQGPTTPEPVISTLRHHKPTVLYSVPGLYRAIARDPSAEGALASVRLCVSAAEELPVATLERWRARFGMDIIDGIGASEMFITYCSNRPNRIASGTAGWPVPGYELRLVDEDGEVLQGPAIGTLHVRGDSCAAYYWHQHEKTKVSMLGDWFVTGDRCERREDGAYVHVGRVDDMLKVGGLWVSPGDVESVLMAHPRVLDAGVVGMKLADATRVVAYIRCAEEHPEEALADELRVWCKERLAPHERPDFVNFVETIPRTPGGKIQRYRLREGVPNPARNPSETLSALAKTWSSVLGTTVSIDDDFFALGGDSLSASELIFALEEDFGLHLSMADLLSAPTILQFADLLGHHRGVRDDDMPARVTSTEHDGPAVFFAAGLGDSVLRLRWLAEALAGDAVIYGLRAWERVPAAPTVEEEAQQLVAGMRSVQPSGPYWLAGYSSGGIVALEVARVLEACGEVVAGLLILDTQLGWRDLPFGLRPTIPKLVGVSLKERIAAYAQGMRSPRLVARRVLTRSGLREWIDERFWKFDLKRRGTVRPSRRNSYLWTMQVRAVERYQPGPCHAPVTLFRCADTPDPVTDRSWSAIARGGLAVRYVDVPHQRMLEPPYVVTVAEQVSDALPWRAASVDVSSAAREGSTKIPGQVQDDNLGAFGARRG